MSELLDKAVIALGNRMQGAFDGSAKFVIRDEGAVMIDGGGIRVSDERADVTLTSDAETFQAILAGDLNPTTAFMQGRLTVEGDMGTAMQLGTVLS
ncbi:SCP2 sterol-binding domain-containing protein [Tropicimonas sp.]|uniref:SCP2 sterol-binding domain-containing protein n=1 Tax=Tropicimonas sp. TaxID=2067044 RepID=UPI003A855BB9